MDYSVGDTWRGAGSIPDFYPLDATGFVSKDATGAVHKLEQKMNQMSSRRVIIDSLQHTLDDSRPSTFEARFENMKRVAGVKLVETTVPRNGGETTLTLRVVKTDGQISDLIITVNVDASLHEIGQVLQAYNQDDVNIAIANSMNKSFGTYFASSHILIRSLPNGFFVTYRENTSDKDRNIQTIITDGEWPAHSIINHTKNLENVWIFTQTSRSSGRKGCPYLCVEGMGILEFPMQGGTLSSMQVPHDAFCLLVEDNDRQKPIVSNRSPAKWFKNPLSSLDRLTVSLKNADGSAFHISDQDRVIFIFDILCE